MYIEKLNNDDFFLEKMSFNFIDYYLKRNENDDEEDETENKTIDIVRDATYYFETKDYLYSFHVWHFFENVYFLKDYLTIKSKNDCYLFLSKVINNISCLNIQYYNVFKKLIKTYININDKDELRIIKHDSDEIKDMVNNLKEYDYLTSHFYSKGLTNEDEFCKYLIHREYSRECLEYFVLYSICFGILLNSLAFIKYNYNESFRYRDRISANIFKEISFLEDVDILPFKNNNDFLNNILSLCRFGAIYNDYYKEQEDKFKSDECYNYNLLYKNDYTSRILLFNEYRDKKDDDSIFLITKNFTKYSLIGNIKEYSADFFNEYYCYVRDRLRFSISFKSIEESGYLGFDIEDYIISIMREDLKQKRKSNFFYKCLDKCSLNTSNDFIGSDNIVYIESLNYPLIFINKGNNDIDDPVLFRHHPKAVDLLKTVNITYKLLNKKNSISRD